MSYTPGSYARIYARDDSSKLSTPSLIGIIVACGCIALLVLALFLWRLISRCLRPHRSNPLPPVQELAHHREQQLVAFSERYASIHLPGTETPPSVWGGARISQSISGTGSAVSLIPGTAESKGHLYADSPTGTMESFSPFSPFAPPPAAELSGPTLSPAPSGKVSPGPPISQSSLTDPSSSLPLMSPSSSSPPPGLSSTMSHEASTSMDTVTSGTGTGSANNTPRNSLLPPHRSQRAHSPSPLSSPPTPPSRSQSRSRPLSAMSTAGTTHSGNPTLGTVRSSIRGAPHLPHNRESMQIILPAPLGLDTRSSSVRLSRHVSVGGRSVSEASIRGSGMADRWMHTTKIEVPDVPIGNRKRSVKEMGGEHTPRRASKLQRRASSYAGSPASTPSDSDITDPLSSPPPSPLPPTPSPRSRHKESRPPRQTAPTSHGPRSHAQANFVAAESHSQPGSELEPEAQLPEYALTLGPNPAQISPETIIVR